MIEGLSTLFIAAGLAFFLAGTVGMLRLPDLYCRLHAVTKADNLGLGLLVLGLMLRADDLLSAQKLLLIWILALSASAAGSQLIALYARRLERERST